MARHLAIDLKGPFIIRFKTEQNNYIYDVNSNQILRVDEVTFDLLPYYRTSHRSQLIQKFIDRYDPTIIEQRINLIEKTSKKLNVFSSRRPKINDPLSNKKELLSKYESKLQQLTLNVSEACNMRCKYCVYSGKYFYKRTHNSRLMNFIVAKRAIDFFLAHSRESENAAITFYGGEPLLNFKLIKDCVEYIKTIKATDQVSLGMTTNGTVLTNEMVDFLISNQISLLVSLDGPRAVHDRYRVFKNGRGSFNVIINNLSKIRELDRDYYDSKISFNIVFAPPYNFQAIDRFISSFYLTQGKKVKSSLVDDWDTTVFQDFSPMERSPGKSFIELRKEYEKSCIESRVDEKLVSRSVFEEPLLRIHQRKMSPLADTWVPTGACIPGLRKIFVSPEGKFYMCEKVDYALSIGDINKGFNFDRIIDLISEYYDMCKVECTDCWAIRLCNLCFAAVERNDRLDMEKMRKNCKGIRQNLHDDLIMYCSILEQNPNAFDYMKDIRLS